MTRGGSTRLATLRLVGGSRRRRFTPVGIDTAALPIRDRHREEHEKGRAVDAPENAGSKKSGKLDGLTASMSRVSIVFLVGDNVCAVDFKRNNAFIFDRSCMPKYFVQSEHDGRSSI